MTSRLLSDLYGHKVLKEEEIEQGMPVLLIWTLQSTFIVLPAESWLVFKTICQPSFSFWLVHFEQHLGINSTFVCCFGLFLTFIFWRARVSYFVYFIMFLCIFLNNKHFYRFPSSDELIDRPYIGYPWCSWGNYLIPCRYYMGILLIWRMQ